MRRFNLFHFLPFFLSRKFLQTFHRQSDIYKIMRFRNIIFILAIISVFSFAVKAQIPPPPPPPIIDKDIIKIDSRLVVVPVSVLDANGQPVTGLTAKDFRILEQNKAQDIAEVSDAEKVPLEIALLIDVSSSVNKIFELEKSAAAQFLREVMRPEDHATVFLITDRPVLTQSRNTADKTALNIRSIMLTKSPTAFYDTVTTAARYLSENTPPHSRRVILALSDGEDNYSNFTRNAEIEAYGNLDINEVTQKQLNQRATRTAQTHVQAQTHVLKALQNADTVFYALNPSGPSIRFNVASRRGQNSLQRFADETGGTTFLPQFVSEKNSASFEQQNIRILETIFRQISAELRAQYLIQYYSEAEYPNGKYINLEVGLNNPQNYRVRARQGYFVKN